MSARAASALLAALSVLSIAAPAMAAQSASISAAFSPDRLGAATAVSFGFSIEATGGGLPSALTGIDFRYPRRLGLGTSDLGLATCNRETLAAHGPKACPPNSIMGRGTALAEFQVSPIVSEEAANIALVAGPSHNGYVNLLISATGIYPVAARVVMSALLEPGRLRFSVPLVPGIPEGPDVAVVRVRATLGGNLTYYERSHGKLVPYRPRGIRLPGSCPAGGFRFGATFSFLDGTRAEAATSVRCPRRR